MRSFWIMRAFGSPHSVKGGSGQALTLRQTALVPLLGLLVAFGCSSSRTDGLPAVLSSLQGGGAVYSLSFYAPPPEGSIVSLALFPGVTSAAACDYFKNLNMPPDFWYLKVEHTSAAVGRYDVVLSNVLPPASPTAQAWAVHVVGQEKVKTYRAHAGRIDVAQVAGDVSEWPGGMDLISSLEATFSESSWKQGACQGGGAPDAAPMTTCTCTGPNSETTTCVAADGADDCCARIDGGADLSLALNIQARQCPWMCASTSPELSGYCVELQQ